MSYDTYTQWLNDGFLARNGGWIPENLKEWHDTVESSHQEIRKIIGAPLLNKRYKLQSLQLPINVDKDPAVVKAIDELEYLLPSLYRDNKLSKESFALPFKEDGNHNGIRISKFVQRYANDYYYGHPNEQNKVAKIMSTLGEAWARARTTECELGTTISTTPKAFTLLGHYGPDNNSCFRQGSSSPKDKYILGQSSNTFIITVSKFDERKKKEKNIGRAFGWYQHNTFYIRNYYFTPGFQEGDFLAVMTKLFDDIYQQPTKIDYDIGSFANIKFDQWQFYQNNYGNWAFLPKQQESVCGEIHLNLNNIVAHICPQCNKQFKNKECWKLVDKIKVCHYCAESANRCELTGDLTFKPLVEFHISETETLEVSEDSVINNHEKCPSCGHYTNILHTIDNVKVCPECLMLEYSYCDIGEHYVLDKDIHDIDDICICTKHKGEHADIAEQVANELMEN